MDPSISSAEHAYGARRSAWRRASLLLSTRPPGASAAYAPPPSPAPLNSLGPATSKHSGGGGAAGTLRGGGEGGDPALAMCRFLRGLGSLAQGDLEAAAGRLEVRGEGEGGRGPADDIGHE